VLVSLSVRSAFDAFLAVSAFPRGAAVLVAAVNIPDMAAIIADHGLVAVPIDLDLATCAVDEDALGRALEALGSLAVDPAPGPARGPRACMVLLSHIFGRRNGVSSASALCRRWAVPLVEDCAEAFTSLAFTGAPDADLSLFSFGAIKHMTALGGGIARVRCPSVYWRMRRHLDALPPVPAPDFARKVAKLGPAAVALNVPAAGAAIVRSARLLGLDHREAAVAMLRGFPGDMLQGIRRRPAPAQLRLLLRRLAAETEARLQAGAGPGLLAERVLTAHRCEARLLGTRALSRGQWLFPVVVARPAAVHARLAALGVDVYRGATQLRCIPMPPDVALPKPARAAWAMERVLYLPVHRAVPQRAVLQIMDAVARATGPRRGLLLAPGETHDGTETATAKL
jgi:dTDP-4-amino-4,6-dideoxygalactose transaminase